MTAPVAIIGWGPVGLMLAMNLDFFGVRSVLINTDTTTRWLPKGSTHNARTLEHFRNQHVAWRGDRLPDDCGALIDTVTGRP